jgi:hypothetical protein
LLKGQVYIDQLSAAGTAGAPRSLDDEPLVLSVFLKPE